MLRWKKPRTGDLKSEDRSIARAAFSPEGQWLLGLSDCVMRQQQAGRCSGFSVALSPMFAILALKSGLFPLHCAACRTRARGLLKRAAS